MFKLTKLITPANILINLEGANEVRAKIIFDNVKLLAEQKKLLEIPELLEIPKVKDLYNYLAVFKKAQFGQKTMYLGDLNAWCIDHQEFPLESEPDLPFVAKFIFFYPDETYTLDDEFETGDQFRFFLTTRRLIEFSSHFKLIIQTDGTYKLTWNNNAILLLGASDFNRVFHPIGLSCSTREAQ
jgi:hypothetical protein